MLHIVIAKAARRRPCRPHIPEVHSRDTVRRVSTRPGNGRGVAFKRYTSISLLTAAVYRDQFLTTMQPDPAVLLILLSVYRCHVESPCAPSYTRAAQCIRAPFQQGNTRQTLEDIARRIPVETMRPYFNYPLRLAADVSRAASRLD